jgi:hypothetical protein
MASKVKSSQNSLISKVATAILAERKALEGKMLSSNHQLTIKQYIDNVAWLFDTFKSINVSFNDDGSTEPVNLTIGF